MSISKEEITSFVKAQGADLCGIADMRNESGYIKKTYGDYFAEFSTAVSFAIFFPKEVVQEQIGGPTRNYITVYGTLNREIDRIAAVTANRLQSAGFRSYPVPASDYRPQPGAERLHWRVAEAGDLSSLPKTKLDVIGIYSHRIAAAKAGLGWVGKSCSIVNKQVGPRMRLGTILTDAPLEGDGAVPNLCGSCELCKNACPVEALRGRAFDPSEELSARFDAMKCFNFWDDMGKVYGLGSCGLCLAACPWGR